jgi:spore coat polysaccharide biosynthesis protein SpsF (cytidylyltransferase family)
MRPIVCTSTDLKDDLIVKEANRLGVEYFRGDLLNKLKRWSSCLEEYQLEKVHIIDGDDPFFDTDEILQRFNDFKHLQLQLMRTSNRSDAGFASLGISITNQFVKSLAKRTELLASQDLDVIPWSLLLKASDNWSSAIDNFLLPDDGLVTRLTLDYEEDYQLLKLLAEKFGPTVNRLELENFLRINPSINAINSHRTEEFLSNKRVQLSRNFRLEN